MIKSVAHCSLDINVDEILQFILQLPASSYPAILDSCCYQDYGLYQGRYLIAAYNPDLCVQLIDHQLYKFSRRGEEIISDNIWQNLDNIYQQFTIDEETKKDLLLADLPCAFGGAIGVFSYDLGRNFECIPATARTTYHIPDLFLAFYSLFIIYDYQEKRSMMIAALADSDKAVQRLELAKKELTRALSRSNKLKVDDLKAQQFNYRSNFSQSQYLQAVSKIKNYIAAGDIYQANLTQQYQINLAGLSPATIFLRLRNHFPMPFAAYLNTPEWTIVSGSPERFLQKHEQTISAFPIKGTRPRGANAQEDEMLANELLNSEKDIAENIMIVDLLRNDLGRICEIASINADELLSLQRLPTVFHLVSKISGKLKCDTKLTDILAATFPCGSITGAPKIRAMEIIEELEGTRRGLSMGALGWLGYNNNFDLNVTIRTLFIQNGIAYLNVGGGVVADSQPILEYQESLIKAQALFRAIGIIS